MSIKLKIEAIIPAAGKGLRFKSRVSKPLVEISGCPILIHTLRVLNAHPGISKIIVLARKGDLKKIGDLAAKNKISKLKCVSYGGATRQKSVEKGLRFLDKNTDLVLIHDAARPFVTERIISRVISAAKHYGAAIAGVPLKPTVKRVKESNLPAGKAGSQRAKEYFVEKTLDRSNLWEIQTPQVFRKDLILVAHQKFKNRDASDDAYLVEKLGNKVSIVESSYFNIKITTPEDLVLAEAISMNLMSNDKAQNSK